VTVDVIVALVTLLGTMIVLIWNIIDRGQSSFEERMSQATDLLTGGTQKRSAGIAIIASFRIRLARRRATSWRTAMTLLLCTQAIYLLEQSRDGDRPDELLNLRRIIELLIAFNFHSPNQYEIAVLAARIKGDLQGVGKLSQCLNRAKIDAIIAKSPAICAWLKAAS
jgi:hypothetical protein